MTKTHWGLVLLGFTPLSVAANASAQKTSAHTIPVLVVIPSSSSNADNVTITRNSVDGYVVTMPATAANAENLRMAVRQVTSLLDRDGDTARDELVVSIPKSDVVAAGRSDHRLVKSLLASHPRDVAGRRNVRATYLFLPDRASRASLKARAH
jgi:hypothetical protein